MDNQEQLMEMKSIVLIGLMGSGKSSVGKRLATTLGMEFYDVDHEIEIAAEQSISEIFKNYGEEEFRALETRVLKRLMTEEVGVIATGGGAYMNPENRDIINEFGQGVWIQADFETLWERVRNKSHRPLLKNENPKETLRELLELRYPVYEQAEHHVHSFPDQPHEDVVQRIIDALGILEKTG